MSKILAVVKNKKQDTVVTTLERKCSAPHPHGVGWKILLDMESISKHLHLVTKPFHLYMGLHVCIASMQSFKTTF